MKWFRKKHEKKNSSETIPAIVPVKKAPDDEESNMFRQVYQIGPATCSQLWKTKGRHYPLVVLAELLIGQGFVFNEAGAAGGVDEVSHSGDKSYYVTYTDLSAFKNFELDYEAAEKQAREDSGGWITYLNFGWIYAELKKNRCSVHASVSDSEIEIIWKDFDDQNDPIIAAVHSKMLEFVS